RYVEVAEIALATAAAMSAASAPVTSASRVSATRTVAGSATLESQLRAADDRSARASSASSLFGRQSSTRRATRYVASATSRGPPSGARPASEARARKRKIGVDSP